MYERVAASNANEAAILGSRIFMKRGKLQAALNVNEALSLKEDLKCQRVLSREQLLHVLQADKSCDSACKGKKDNPNCLCGLIPAVGSVRRKGLWQKEPQGLQHLGANPADQKRQVLLPAAANTKSVVSLERMPVLMQHFL